MTRFRFATPVAEERAREVDRTPQQRGVKDAELDTFIRDRTGGCQALADTWPRSEWKSAHLIQKAMRPMVTVPGAFFVKNCLPSWLRQPLRRVPLLEASHCTFPAWFAVASPAVDWFGLADTQPDFRLTSDACTGAPSIDALRSAARLAAAYSGQLTLHVVLAPISEGAEVEGIVCGAALSGAAESTAFLSVAIARQFAFDPTRRLRFTLPESTEPTLLSWEWGAEVVRTSWE